MGFVKLSTQKLRREPSKSLVSEDYLDLIHAPTKLFNPYRLLIMQTLMLHGNVEFRQLRHNIPEMTDGNLASHLRVLEKLGYVHYHKEIVNRMPRTSYEITEEGRNAFGKIVSSLRKMIKYGPNI